jgi:hypothetical protein
MAIGYSGTPLARKLSLKDGQRVWWEGMPDSVRAEIEREGLALDLLPEPEAPIEAAHIFVTRRAELEEAIGRLLPRLDRAGFLWSPGRRKPRRCRPTSPRT